MATDNNNPTRPVRKGEGLDWPLLDRHLKSVLPFLEGEVEVSQFAGGNSNLTYRLKYLNTSLGVRANLVNTKSCSEPFPTHEPIKLALTTLYRYQLVCSFKPGKHVVLFRTFPNARAN